MLPTKRIVNQPNRTKLKHLRARLEDLAAKRWITFRDLNERCRKEFGKGIENMSEGELKKMIEGIK